MPKVLVTGGHGYLGSHLVEQLLASGHRVHCLSRNPLGLLPVSLMQQAGYRGFCGSFSDARLLDQALDGCDLCVHLAWGSLPQTSNSDPRTDLSANVLGTLELLEACDRAGVKRFVFLSSGGTVYGFPQQVPIPEDHPTHPTCAYGISKLAVEKYLTLYAHLRKMQSVTLRVANPYGGRQRLDAPQGAVAVFLGRALRADPIEIWGDGTVVRDFVALPDVLRALQQAIDLTGALPVGEHQLFNIGSGEGLSLNSLLDVLDQSLGRRVERRYLPGRGFDVPVSVLAIERARRDLDWRPEVGLHEGLAAFYKRFALASEAGHMGRG